MNCVTCLMVQSELGFCEGVIYRDQTVVVNHCLDVLVPGYVIVSPCRHVENFGQMELAEIMAISRIIKEIHNILRELPGVENVYIGNFGEETRHFHYHIFPRYDWMLGESYEDIHTNGKLDGAKLFSYMRTRYKTFGNLREEKIINAIDFIRKEMGVCK